MENFYKEAEEHFSYCYNRPIYLTRDFTIEEIEALKLVCPVAVQCGLSFEETKDIIMALSDFKPRNVSIELRKMLVRLDHYPHARKVTDKSGIL